MRVGSIVFCVAISDEGEQLIWVDVINSVHVLICVNHITPLVVDILIDNDPENVNPKKIRFTNDEFEETQPSLDDFISCLSYVHVASLQ